MNTRFICVSRREDEYSVQLLARLEEVLVDFAKGSEASELLVAPSPQASLLEKGRDILKKAREKMSPPRARRAPAQVVEQLSLSLSLSLPLTLTCLSGGAMLCMSAGP
jgi:hypothetical protein